MEVKVTLVLFGDYANERLSAKPDETVSIKWEYKPCCEEMRKVKESIPIRTSVGPWGGKNIPNTLYFDSEMDHQIHSLPIKFCPFCGEKVDVKITEIFKKVKASPPKVHYTYEYEDQLVNK